MTDRLLTAQEIAELLAVPASWVYAQAREGTMPHVQLGKYVRFRRESVLAWVDALEQDEQKFRKHQPRAAA